MALRLKHWYIWVLSLFVCLSGIMFGYDVGSINGVKEMAGFREVLNLTATTLGNDSCPADGSVEDGAVVGLVVSVFSISGFFGSLLAGVVADFAGRKITIMSGGFLYGVGGVIQCAAFFTWMVFLGRVIGGFGVGILFMVVPVYIAELAPKKLRGRLVSNNHIMLTLGIFLGNIVNLIFSRFEFGWRISLAVQAVVGFVYTAGMLLFPESPRWLIRQGKEERAIRIIARVECCAEERVKAEVKEIKEATKDITVRSKLKDLLKWSIVQRIMIGMVLQLFNRITGITVIMYYSVYLFCNIGVPGFTVAVVLSLVNFLSASTGIPLIDKVGRKVLLLYGAVAMMLSMTLSGSLLVGFQVEDGGGNTAVAYTVVAGICLFSINYAFTWGPGTFVVSTEIYPQSTRGVAVAIATSIFWLGNFFNAQFTPILLASPLRIFGTLYLLAGIHALAFFFTLFTLPETKGETLEGTEAIFSKPWLERVNILYYLRLGCCCPPRCGKRKEAEEPQDLQLQPQDLQLQPQDLQLQPKIVLGQINTDIVAVTPNSNNSSNSSNSSVSKDSLQLE